MDLSNTQSVEIIRGNTLIIPSLLILTKNLLKTDYTG